MVRMKIFLYICLFSAVRRQKEKQNIDIILTILFDGSRTDACAQERKKNAHCTNEYSPRINE